MLAHELRNPLVPIRNAVELLRTFTDGPHEQRVREMIERQVAHMARLIEDLLDVSRIQSGKIVLRPEPVFLSDVLSHGLEVAAPIVRQHGHTLTVSESPKRLRVAGDAGR